MDIKIYSNIREVNIDEDAYPEIFEKRENDSIFKDFKEDFFNTRAKCRNCGRSIRESLITGFVGCPKCYSALFSKIDKKGNKTTLFNTDNLEKLISLRKNKYKGRKIDKSTEYYELKTKICELERELKLSIENEDYLKCNILKDTIDNLNDKKLKIRRKING